MGGHWAVSHVFHLEGRPWHVAVDDFIHATTTAIRRDAKDQRSLSLQRLRNRTSHGDGTRRRPATAEALHGRHGSHGSRGSVEHLHPQTVETLGVERFSKVCLPQFL